MKDNQLVLSASYINDSRLPGGWKATIERLKMNKWEVRVYDPFGSLCFVDSLVKTRELADAVAHREAWGQYAELLK